MLYPFKETRKKLSEGAKQAMKVIPECKPYKLDMPIKAKMQHLVFEGSEKKPKLVTKEGTVTNALHMTRF
jgi:hypothetical protein